MRGAKFQVILCWLQAPGIRPREPQPLSTSVPTTFERARRFSQLAHECDQLAQIQTDPALKEHYEKIAIDYFTLAEAELRLAHERQERVRKSRQRSLGQQLEAFDRSDVVSDETKQNQESFPDLLGKLPPRKPAAPSIGRARRRRRTGKSL